MKRVYSHCPYILGTFESPFIAKTWNRWYKYFVLGREEPYFVKEYSDFNNKFT